MINAKKINKLTHPELALRMAQACDSNPDVPPQNYGRLGWFVAQIKSKSGKEVTAETVRKWLAGEARPRHTVMGIWKRIRSFAERL